MPQRAAVCSQPSSPTPPPPCTPPPCARQAGHESPRSVADVPWVPPTAAAAATRPHHRRILSAPPFISAGVRSLLYDSPCTPEVHRNTQSLPLCLNGERPSSPKCRIPYPALQTTTSSNGTSTHNQTKVRFNRLPAYRSTTAPPLLGASPASSSYSDYGAVESASSSHSVLSFEPPPPPPLRCRSLHAYVEHELPCGTFLQRLFSALFDHLLGRRTQPTLTEARLHRVPRSAPTPAPKPQAQVHAAKPLTDNRPMNNVPSPSMESGISELTDEPSSSGDCTPSPGSVCYASEPRKTLWKHLRKLWTAATTAVARAWYWLSV